MKQFLLQQLTKAQRTQGTIFVWEEDLRVFVHEFLHYLELGLA